MPTRPPLNLSAPGPGPGSSRCRVPSVMAIRSAGRSVMSIPIGTLTIGADLLVGDQQTGLDAAEGHGDVGQEGHPADPPGVRLDPAGQVDRDPQRVGGVRLARPARPRSRRSGGLADSPTSPSMMTSACSITSFDRRVVVQQHPAPARRSAASPPWCALSGSVSTAVTRIPLARRNAPAYSASPPLLPEPTSSTTWRPGMRRRHPLGDHERDRVGRPAHQRARHRPWPARSASTARICSTE